MAVLHICNTFFETELEADSPRPLSSWLSFHPVVSKLQTLPLLYANPEDRILVTKLPENPDPRLVLIETTPPSLPIEHWGPSLAISEWAKKKNLPYSIPPWETVQQINSKIFSFSASPKLPGAELLRDPQELFSWMEKVKGPKVLKTAFGNSARGHFHIRDPILSDPEKKKLERFFEKQFEKKLAIIGEPWVERVFDFSTQWFFGETLSYLGATQLINTPRGGYDSTRVGGSFSPFEWALDQHLRQVKPILNTLCRLGHKGNLGIDAFVYRSEGKEQLHPIVEINARKTMGWVALMWQKKRSHQEKDALFRLSKNRAASKTSSLEDSRLYSAGVPMN